MRPLTVLLRRFLQAWRGSLTVRVLAISLGASLLISTSVSAIAIVQVRDGLLDDRVKWSLRQAADGLDSAVRVVGSLPQPTNQGERIALVEAVVAAVAAPSGRSGDYEVLMLAGPGAEPLSAPERGTNQVELSSVADELRTVVQSQKVQAWQVNVIHYTGGRSSAGVIVGSPLLLPGIGRYEVYQLFPLTREVAMLDLTRQAVGLAGLLLVIALLGVSLLITREVVGPIRKAAESAERLRQGRLTERLPVRGQDDLATLAKSFNAMAASMQEQIRRLEGLSHVQQQFVSDVSHELRTPLTTIRMAAEMLYSEREAFDPASARAAELLQQQSLRFEALLSDLLEVSRFDAGTVKLEASEVDISGIIARVLDDLSTVAASKSARLELRMPEPVGLIRGDARRLERVVRNLVANAIEHSEGQPVLVALAGTDAAVSVSVRDFGAGLEPGAAALVFNRFWRADPSRQRTLGGTGLGLAISLEDARLHGGWLEADGAAGIGANFRLVLPREPHGEIGTPPLPLALEEIDHWIGQTA